MFEKYKYKKTVGELILSHECLRSAEHIKDFSLTLELAKRVLYLGNRAAELGRKVGERVPGTNEYIHKVIDEANDITAIYSLRKRDPRFVG